MDKVILVGKDRIKGEQFEMLINQAKGEVCKEFEKVCPTDLSFKRMKKDMHDIFDELLNDLHKLID